MTSKPFTLFATCGLIALGSCAQTDAKRAAVDIDAESRKAEAMEIAQEFVGILKPELMAAVKSGGPVNAIEVCSKRAPEIAATLADKSGWEVSRVSLRNRNPEGAPDDWERIVLQEFDNRKAAGENPDSLARSEEVTLDNNQHFRFMKAQPVGDLCLTCHGADVNADVLEKIQSIYPDDAATGYSKGDIRGAISLVWPPRESGS